MLWWRAPSCLSNRDETVRPPWRSVARTLVKSYQLKWLWLKTLSHQTPEDVVVTSANVWIPMHVVVHLGDLESLAIIIASLVASTNATASGEVLLAPALPLPTFLTNLQVDVVEFAFLYIFPMGILLANFCSQWCFGSCDHSTKGTSGSCSWANILFITVGFDFLETDWWPKGSQCQ